MMWRWLVLAVLGVTLGGCNEIEQFANIEDQVKVRMADENQKIVALRSVSKQVDGHEKFDRYFRQAD